MHMRTEYMLRVLTGEPEILQHSENTRLEGHNRQEKLGRGVILT